MKVLLHACCAPCLIHPVEVFGGEGRAVTVLFYNPNIHPYREYLKRYLEVEKYCLKAGIQLSAGRYRMELFLSAVAGLELLCADLSVSGGGPGPRGRCLACYRLRLDAAAVRASELKAESFTTTLLVSPYQDHEAVIAAGHEAAGRRGVVFDDRDMRPGYNRAVAASRDLGMYRQGYCGCVYSEKERYQKQDPPG